MSLLSTIGSASSKAWGFARSVIAAADPYFEYVSLLLNGDGTNGAQNNTFLDSSTNNFTITRNGNTTQGSFSPYGSNWSNYFVGTSGSSASPNYLATPSSSVWAFGTGAFTLECWGYLTSAPDVANGWNFFDFRTGTSLTVGWQNDQMFTYDGTTTITSSSVSSYLNKWTHWAWMRSGSTVYLFANGVVIGSGSMSTNFGTSASVCTINARYSGVQSAGGFFSNARVSNIARYATTGFTPATTNFTNDANTLLLTMQNNRFIDNSSNAFTLTVNGTPSVQRFSPFNPTAPYSTSVIGGSGYFDGSGDYLTTPSNAAVSNTLLASDFTIECWFYVTSATWSGGAVLWGNSVSNSDGFSASYLNTDGSIGTGKVGVNEFTSSAGAWKLNQWTHFALVRNGSTLYMYLNGVQVATGAASTYLNTSATKPMTIGSNYQSTPAAIPGYITDTRVVSSVVYTTAFTPPTTPLTAITNTQLLLSYTNAGIPDLAMQNDLQTVGNAQVSTSVKKYGTGSLAFDGTGDYLMTPSSPQWIMSGDWTIECWIYPTSVSGVNAIIDTRNRVNGATSPVMYLNGTSLVIDTGSASVISAGTISINTWYHVAATRSGNSWRLFIDGTQVGSTTTNTTSYTVAYGCTIGSSRFNEDFDGYMDDVRISKFARYTANFTPPTAALPIY